MLKHESGMAKSLVMASCLAAASMLGTGVSRCDAASVDVDQLFQDARAQAAVLEHDTDIMEGFTHSNVSWEAHAGEVDNIKSHINKLGSIVFQLQTARGDCGAQHQESIDRLLSPLQELAVNTSAIIDHLNQNRDDLNNSEYQEYLEENAALASDIFHVISDTVAYDGARDKIEKLQAKYSRADISLAH